jgi:UDP-2,3-diacylglucosamine pyrophosphatase LpxH
MPQYYRSVFLSDFHIGAKKFDAAALLDFLQSFECEYLFLVGDIIDGWKLNKRWFWTEDCSRVIDALVSKASHGTKIIYLPGNHDDDVRRISALRRHRFEKMLGLTITDKFIHTLGNGKKFIVLHGDQFDRRILRGPVSRWSDWLHDTVLELLGPGPARITIDGKPMPFSLAKTLSRHGQWALRLLNNFENAVYKKAANRGLDGLICGHTHIPVIKNIRHITYANCGSWVRGRHTALIENAGGDLELVDWPPSFEQPMLFDPLWQQEPAPWKIVPDASRHREITLMILAKIRKTWPVKTRKPMIFHDAAAGLRGLTQEAGIMTRLSAMNTLVEPKAT